MFSTQFLFNTNITCLRAKANAAAVMQHRDEWIMRIKWQINNLMKPTFMCPQPPSEGSPVYTQAMRYTELLHIVESAK